jgi:amino acid transporter
MMALAGIIGPGLLVGAGGALAAGGPASLLIGFGVIGIIAFSIMQSLGELTTLYPTGGAFTGLSDRFVDKAFGVAVGKFQTPNTSPPTTTSSSTQSSNP